MKKYLNAYLQNRPLFYSFIRPKELELFNEDKPFKRPILDFGCGDGFFAKVLFENKKVDFGVDIDENVLKEAKKSGIYEKVVVCDGKTLPFKSNTFLTVISNCVLEHVDKLLPTLKEIRRVMKKSEMFYCTVMTDKWEDYLIGGKLFGKHYLNWMRKIQRHPNLLSVSGWEKVFKMAGFKVVRRKDYIDKKTSRLIELSHYLSMDSLISFKFFKKWVLFPWRFKIIEGFIINDIRRVVASDGNSATAFFILETK